MIDDAFVQRWVSRLRQEFPDAVAVFLGGSQLRGEAGPHSDVDFDVVVPDGPRDEWPAWVDRSTARPVRVSIWLRDADTWLAEQDVPQGWAFYLPSADPLRLCWVADESWRARLDRSSLVHPAGPPELDHFVSDVAKVANAHAAGDELALRLAGHDLAHACVSLLQPLNPRPPVTSRRAALLTILSYDVAPPGFHDDVLVCLGLTGRPADAADLYATARRLATGVLDLVERHATTLAPLLATFEATSLRDGSLGQHVTDLVSDHPTG